MGGIAWKRVLVGGLIATGVGLVAPDSVRAFVVQLVGWLYVILVLVRARQLRPGTRLPWYLLALSGALGLVGGIVRVAHSEITGVSDPFPSPADGLYLSVYIFAIATGLILIRSRTLEKERAYLLDALMVAAAVGVVVWAELLAPHVRDASAPLFDRTINVLYSVLALGLLSVVLRLVVGPGTRNPSYYLFAGSVFAVFACDLLATLETTRDVETTSLVLGLTPLIYVLFAAAALHPSMVRLTEAPTDQVMQLTWRREVLLAIALLVAPGVLVWQLIRDDPVDLPVVVTGSVVLSLLVLARLGGLVRAKERSAERERVLREAGTSLVVATSRDEILDGTLETVLALHGGDAQALVLLGDEHELTLVAASDAGTSAAVGTKARADDLPPSMRDALRERRVTRVVGATNSLTSSDGSANGHSAMVVMPLVSQNELRGTIVVTSSRFPDRETVRALEALSSEVALSLESAALTEALHRRRSEARFRALIENSSDLVVVLGRDRSVTFVSPACERLLGQPERFYIGRDALEIAHPDDRSVALHVLDGSVPGDEPDPVEIRLLHAEGAYRWFEILAHDLRQEPDIAGVVINARDITDRKGTEQLLARSEARFRALVQNSSDVVAVVDENAFFVYVSPAVTEMLGYKPDELVGSSVLTLLPPEETASALRLHRKVITEPFEQASVETRVQNRDGGWHTVDVTITDLRDEPAVQGIVLNARDVTVRKELERDLRKQALHDALTGLGNRAMFIDRVTQALEREDSRHVVAVLFVDLDDFKTVNDSLGHEVGDALLVLVAGRLSTCLRESDVAARLGGDEFAVLLESTFTEAEVFGVADRVLGVMRTPFTINDRELTVTASVGIAVSHDNESAEVLLRNADTAMYLAKERGKDRSEVFEEEMHASVFERLEMRTDLAHGIEHEQLRLHYQPIVGLQSGRIVGVEALVRWQHPERGLLSPATFVPLAEQTGLVVPLGQWVIAESCRQLSEWRAVLPDGALRVVSVNLSVRQLQREGVVEEVAAAIARHGLQPRDLAFEITESMLMDDTDATRQNLFGLRELGVSLAVDDFGTGYSSLRYIKDLPIDTIKIDRTFVEGLGTEQGDTDVVRAVISMAEGLRVRTVGEGIEGAEQLEALRGLGCDLGQGFYFSYPVPADDLERLVRAGLEGEAFGWEQ